MLNSKDPSFTLGIHKIIVKMIYYYGKLFGNIFLHENTIKLLTDNIYPSTKIESFVELPFMLNDLQHNNMRSS